MIGFGYQLFRQHVNQLYVLRFDLCRVSNFVISHGVDMHPRDLLSKGMPGLHIPESELDDWPFLAWDEAPSSPTKIKGPGTRLYGRESYLRSSFWVLHPIITYTQMWYSWQFFPRFAINQNRQRSAPCRGWTFAACQAGRALGGSGGGCWLGLTAKVAEPSHNYCVVNPVTPMMNCLVWFGPGLDYDGVTFGQLGIVNWAYYTTNSSIFSAYWLTQLLEPCCFGGPQNWNVGNGNRLSNELLKGQISDLFSRANSRWKWWKWCNILNSLQLPLIPGTPTFLWLQNSQPWTDGSPVDPPEGCKECCSWAARRRGRVILQATHVDPSK